MSLINIPNELKKINNWVFVELVPKKNGKTDKIPIGVSNSSTYKLSWTKPRNLMRFESCINLLNREEAKSVFEKRFDGLGFVLKGTNLMCVDLDNALVNGKIQRFAEEILTSFKGAYVELSQSKTGFHIIMSKEGWDEGIKRGKFEDGSGIDVLVDSSYVMLTGDIYDIGKNFTSKAHDFSILNRWREKLIGQSSYKTYSTLVSFDHNLPLADWPVERIKNELLTKIPDFKDRERWLKVGFALHTQTRGSAEGLALYHEYSSRTEAYEPEEVDKVWKSAKADPHRANLTLRWLLGIANNYTKFDNENMLGDLDNARLFRSIFEGTLLYCHSKSKWLRYTGSRWDWCLQGEEIEAAKIASEKLAENAAEQFKIDPRSHAAKYQISHAKQSRAHKRLTAMLALAASEPNMSVASLNNLDADPMLLGVQNGVIDLETGELLNANPKLLTTRQVSANYNPASKCPLWKKFINETFLNDKNMVDYIQKALGYSITGNVQEELLHFCYGKGSNGKSVMANVIQQIMADYVVTANFDLLSIKDSSATNDIARLAGARIVFANETKENQRLDDQRLKALVSTERIAARFLYGENFEFKPQFKIWLRGNHKPIITDNSEGAWRRMRLIPFENQIPREMRDDNLEKNLLTEKEGILNWLVEGCIKWQKEKLNNVPEKIFNASTGYREESDVIGEFIEDCCIEDRNASILQSELFNEWRNWCARNGLPSYSQKSFTRQLGTRDFNTVRNRKDGIIHKFYQGIKLNHQALGRAYSRDFYDYGATIHVD